MEILDETSILDEARECRLRALAYLGSPEGEFLIRAAKAFEVLAEGERPNRGSPRDRGLSQT